MKFDIHQKITNKIIAAMEKGTAPWSPEWTGGPVEMPQRANGQYYRGINTLVLWSTAAELGYTSPMWMTYRQAQELGGQVRKGEKGETVVKFGTFEKTDKKTDETTKRSYLKAYTVFNVQQIDGLPEKYAHKPQAATDTGARPIPQLEAFYNSRGAKIICDGSQPRYVPSLDVIHMPTVSQFISAESYYGTLAHELIHWTGHAKRLDRLKKFGSTADYAFEELIAELGACFTTAQSGGVRSVERSAAYIESWLQALRNDKKYIFKAATAAAKATDFLFDQARDNAQAA